VTPEPLQDTEVPRWDPRLVHGAPDGPLARPLAPTMDIVVDSSLCAMTGVTHCVRVFALSYQSSWPPGIEDPRGGRSLAR